MQWLSEQPQPTPAQIAAAVLPATKAARIEAVKAERDRREIEGGFPVNFPGVGAVRFHSDLLSRSHLNNLFSGAFKMRAAFQAGDDTPIPGAASNPGWKCMGRDERVPMTVKRCELLDAAAMAHVGALHVAAATHIAAINLLEDAGAVTAYDISTGWPA